MEKVDISWHDHQISIHDSYKSGPQFTFLCSDNPTDPKPDKLYQAHQWTRCRDMVGTFLDGGLRDAYTDHGDVGYVLGSRKPSIDKVRLGIRVGAPEAKEGTTFDDRLSFLVWQMEDHLGIKRTEMLPYELPGSYNIEGKLWSLEADPFWMKAPPLFSLYLLALRVTPYVEERNTLPEIFTSRLPSLVGGKYLSELSITIMKLLDQGTEAWKLQDIIGYYGGDHFYNRGLRNFSLWGPATRKKFMETGKIK